MDFIILFQHIQVFNRSSHKHLIFQITQSIKSFNTFVTTNKKFHNTKIYQINSRMAQISQHNQYNILY